MPKDTLIFDLDGTLIDSIHGIAASLNAALAEVGRPALGLDAVKVMIGEGGRKTVALGLDATGGSTGIDIEAVFQSWTRTYIEVEVAKTEPYPGVIATLELLAAQGFRLGLCTNKTRQVAIPILEAAGLARFFGRAVVTPEDTPYPKPDGRHILAAVELVGGERSRSVYVGDSEIDYAAARDAEIAMVLVSYGYPHGRLADMKADAVIDEFAGLPATVLRLG
jgi:phosphoglycolate phosphatase